MILTVFSNSCLIKLRVCKGATLTGRILKILARTGAGPTAPNSAVVFLEYFNVSENRDGRLNMPVLLKTDRVILVEPIVRTLSCSD